MSTNSMNMSCICTVFLLVNFVHEIKKHTSRIVAMDCQVLCTSLRNISFFFVLYRSSIFMQLGLQLLLVDQKINFVYLSDRRRKLEDFVNVAGPMGVTHFVILSNPKSMPHLHVASTSQGPTLTFKIHEYALAADVIRSQSIPVVLRSCSVTCPYGDQHLKLTRIMLRNIFLATHINTAKLSSCRSIILLSYNNETNVITFGIIPSVYNPLVHTQRIRKFVLNDDVPDLRNLQDVSDFLTKAGYGSESEADEESATQFGK
ncbi:hypothetical protein MUK42_22723 [Musa troglodytarum]|uniref:Brix domain-containing protein n=1 Tax=Musa troglodytarum TaxID=320322 RepID=A0A9E7FY34_9LILI|nr:hypothetical protein MUK42_22723 [Musa troglodytarum]